MRNRKVKGVVDPEEGWGRFFMDDSTESREAFNVLRTAPLRVITVRVAGEMGPELVWGRRTYEGLEEIKQLIEG